MTDVFTLLGRGAFFRAPFRQITNLDLSGPRGALQSCGLLPLGTGQTAARPTAYIVQAK